MRPTGSIYIVHDRELQKPRMIDGKRFSYRQAYLSKPEAEGAAAAYRAHGHLARVIPRTVVTKKRGHELGYDKVQGYVLYVHHPEERQERKHAGGVRHTSTHTCTKPPSDPTFSKEWSGVSGAPHARGKHCPDCGEQLHLEAGSFYCPRCDNYKRPAEGY